MASSLAGTTIRWTAMGVPTESTLYVVRSSGLKDRRRGGSFSLFRDVDQLFGTEGLNVLLVKSNCWPGL